MERHTPERPAERGERFAVYRLSTTNRPIINHIPLYRNSTQRRTNSFGGPWPGAGSRALAGTRTPPRLDSVHEFPEHSHPQPEQIGRREEVGQLPLAEATRGSGRRRPDHGGRRLSRIGDHRRTDRFVTPPTSGTGIDRRTDAPATFDMASFGVWFLQCPPWGRDDGGLPDPGTPTLCGTLRGTGMSLKEPPRRSRRNR